MFDFRSLGDWKCLWRYCQAGAVNTLFGYGMFAIFVRLGLNIYLAQIMSHVLGATFNYVTYSRYAFVGRAASRRRFIFSYVGNYVMGLGALALLARIFTSPYLAGLLSAAFVSAVNFLVLRRLVFIGRGN